MSAALGTVTSPPPAAPPASRFSAPAVPVAVPPRRTTRVDIPVPAAVPAAGLSVSLTLTHPRPGDLFLRLTAPDGRRVVLSNRRGGLALTGTGTTFTDAAVGTASKPDQPLATLAGPSARGTWVLEIFDLGDGAPGTLTAATLGFGG